MTYKEAEEIIKLIIIQYKNGYYISQVDYNNFNEALKLLNQIKLIIKENL